MSFGEKGGIFFSFLNVLQLVGWTAKPDQAVFKNGSTFFSAIASNLAKGFDLDTSVERAKKYISGALAAMLDLGKGSGPMDHGFAIKNEFTLSHDEITAEAADKEAK